MATYQTTRDADHPSSPTSSTSCKTPPPADTNGSDLCTGINPLTPIVTPADHRLLSSTSPETCTAHESTCRVPYDIVETIVAHLARDLAALEACSLTCRSWRIAATRHLLYTVTFKGNKPDAIQCKPKSLRRLHEQGLLHVIQEVRVWDMGDWFVPPAFRHGDLLYFSALANVHSLVVRGAW